MRASLQSKQSQLQVQIAVVKSQYLSLTPGQRTAMADPGQAPAGLPAPAPGAPAPEALPPGAPPPPDALPRVRRRRRTHCHQVTLQLPAGCPALWHLPAVVRVTAGTSCRLR